MPLPMVHLGIAFQLAIQLDRLPSSAFLLGSIAPDAIHMRVGADGTAKRIIHLNEPPDTIEHDAIRELLHPYSQVKAPLLHFAAGYAAHLLADRLWNRTIIQPLQVRYAASMDAPTLRVLYYQETDQIDFNLYHRMAWQLQAWDLLDRAVAPDFPPLLTAQEVNLWRQRTLQWFDKLKQEPKSCRNILPTTMLQPTRVKRQLPLSSSSQHGTYMIIYNEKMHNQSAVPNTAYIRPLPSTNTRVVMVAVQRAARTLSGRFAGEGVRTPSGQPSRFLGSSWIPSKWHYFVPATSPRQGATQTRALRLRLIIMFSTNQCSIE